MKIELCCQNLNDCIIAEKNNIDRIELNSSLALGGLTPFLEILKEVKNKIKIPVIAMLRLREGNFIYDKEEIDIMEKMLFNLLEADTNGIAFGALTKNHTIDTDTLKRFVKITKQYKKEFVFHRAFDTINDIKNIEILIKHGVDRLLTSGMKISVNEGIENLKIMQENYGKEIKILAGSGVNAENIKRIYEYTGIDEFHGSFSKKYKTDYASDVNFGDHMLCDENILKCLNAIKM